MINKIILKLLLMMCITCLEYTLIYSRFVHMTVKVCSFLREAVKKKELQI